jgi:multidrug resistance efflux pump
MEAAVAPPEQPAAQGGPALTPDRVLARVPGLRDGQLLFVGTEVAPGEAVPADRRVAATVSYLVVPISDKEAVKPEEVIHGSESTRWRRWRDGDAIQSHRIRLHKVQKEYKRLVLGDEIKAGQLVGRIDTTLAAGDLAIKIAALGAAESEARAARKTKEEAERRVSSMEASMWRVPGSVSKDDYEGARLTASRYREEEVARNAAILKIQHDLNQANTVLTMHEIRSPVSGVVASIETEPGDPVKALDTVLTVLVRSATGQAPGARDTGKDRLVRVSRDGVLLGFNTEVVTPGNGKVENNYRRLRAGDLVEAGALIARLDDKLARDEVTLKEAQIGACEADLRARIRAREEVERRVTAMEESMKRIPGSVSKDDYENARLTASRYREEEVAGRSRVLVAQAECDRAKIVLRTHEIRSPVRGVVRELLKVPGEAVRVGEPVVRLAVVEKPG